MVSLDQSAWRSRFLSFKREQVVITAVVIASLSVIFLFLNYSEVNVSYFGPFHAKYILSSEDIVNNDYTPFVRPISLENASAVFNIINGAAANKDQNIYPNGVAFLPAYVPEGTLLYHGNNHGEIPVGVGWTALDYEFSYAFIGYTWKLSSNSDTEDKPKRVKPRGLYPGGSHKPPPKSHNTMLAFEVMKPLNKLIFIDGSSGSKGSGGELDTQMILGNVPKGEDVSEYGYAESVCKWGKPWGLDGIIRIETGFEIIICDMHSPKLRLSSNTTLDWFDHLLGLPAGLKDSNKDLRELIVKASSVASFDQRKIANNHDSRDKRILIDYKGFITALNKTWVDPDPYERRLIDISQNLKDDMRNGIRDYLQSDSHADPYRGTDWQLVTNEIVGKFSNILQLMHNYIDPLDISKSTDSEYIEVVNNVTALTGNFVGRFSEFNLDENERVKQAKLKAVYEYSHFHGGIITEHEILIWSSIVKVTEQLVDVQFDFFEISKKIVLRYYVDKKSLDDLKSEFEEVRSKFERLFRLLNWASFYSCDHQCGLDSICHTPFGLDGASRLPKTLQCSSLLETGWD